MFDSLAQRQKCYENATDYKLIRRIPFIIRVDGISFSNACKKLKKPYEPLLLEAMAETMFFVAQELIGCCFAYQQSDEISFVMRNDQTLESEPWFGNRIQKITTAVASMTTYHFRQMTIKYNLDLNGKTIFDARVVALPNLSETINNLIWRQQDCYRNAISSAAISLLKNKYGNKAFKILNNKSFTERIDLLMDECSINFEEEYPNSFRMGTCSYKIPYLFNNKTRKKWKLDWDTPSFITQRDFIFNILSSGADVVREENIELKE